MIKVEIVFGVEGSADIALPDDLVTEAVNALAPAPDEEPDAFEIWEWITENKPEWVEAHARGQGLLDAADLSLPTTRDIDSESPSGLLPDWFYEQADAEAGTG